MKHVSVRLSDEFLAEIDRLDTLGVARNAGDALKRALMVVATMGRTELFDAVLAYKSGKKSLEGRDERVA